MKDKFKSRKWIAWVVWTIISIGSIAGTAFGLAIPLSIVLSFYGAVTLIWLGVEGGADMISARNLTSREK